MQQHYPFQPSGGSSTTLSQAVTASSAQITIPPVTAGGEQMRITVKGTSQIYWAYGNVTASVSTSTPMLPNTVEVFDCPAGTTQLSVIGDTTGSTIYITVGKGS